MILSILIFAILEAYRNYYIIEKQKKSPHNLNTWLLRGTIFIVINVVFGFSWIKAICSGLVFQSPFNYFLNTFRKRPYYDYGDEGLDKFKSDSKYWFWFDFGLAVVAIVYLIAT